MRAFLYTVSCVSLRDMKETGAQASRFPSCAAIYAMHGALSRPIHGHTPRKLPRSPGQSPASSQFAPSTGALIAYQNVARLSTYFFSFFYFLALQLISSAVLPPLVLLVESCYNRSRRPSPSQQWEGGECHGRLDNISCVCRSRRSGLLCMQVA